MKKLLLTAAVALVSVAAVAQSIGKNELKAIQGSFVKDPATVALQNIISHNTDVNALSQSLTNPKLDNHFKYSVDVKGITNQRSSGRCWLFASLNELRPVAAQ